MGGVMGTQYIFPMKVLKWDSLQTSDGRTIGPGDTMHAIGFIPVYGSIQAMINDHGRDCECGTFVAKEEPAQ